MTDTERERVKAICEAAGVNEIDDVSDGFHTFRQLYYQRMMLFAVIVKQNKDRAWKSLRHEDGELCFGGGWFIVGIDTPEGSYTYHYENKYWDMFDCVDLPRAKHWDGHTEVDAETRLMSLESEIKTDGDTISRQAAIDVIIEDKICDDSLKIMTAIGGGDKAEALNMTCDRHAKMLMGLPSAQPEYRLDEWCTDCKEYDTEKHCCPRFNQVIRTTLDEMKSERKKGEWLRYGEDGYPNNEDTVFWQCDQCLEQYTGRAKKIPNFCPNCGADMRGE